MITYNKIPSSIFPNLILTTINKVPLIANYTLLIITLIIIIYFLKIAQITPYWINWVRKFLMMIMIFKMMKSIINRKVLVLNLISKILRLQVNSLLIVLILSLIILIIAFSIHSLPSLLKRQKIQKICSKKRYIKEEN